MMVFKVLLNAAMTEPRQEAFDEGTTERGTRVRRTPSSRRCPIVASFRRIFLFFFEQHTHVAWTLNTRKSVGSVTVNIVRTNARDNFSGGVVGTKISIRRLTTNAISRPVDKLKRIPSNRMISSLKAVRRQPMGGDLAGANQNNARHSTPRQRAFIQGNKLSWFLIVFPAAEPQGHGEHKNPQPAAEEQVLFSYSRDPSPRLRV
jgi:hypothetical protein